MTAPSRLRLLVAWMAGLLALHIVLALAEPFGTGGRRQLASSTLQFAVEALGAIVVWWSVARMPPGRDRKAGVLLGLAATSYALGIAYVVLLDLTGGELTYPSVGDAFWLAFPVLAAASFLRRSVDAGDRKRWPVGVLDVVITGLGVFFLAWVFWFGDVVRTLAGDSLARLVTAGYPFGDVLIITALLTYASRLPAGHWRWLWPMMLGAAIIWATDTAYTWRSVHGDYSTSGIPEIGWPLGFAVLAVGAWVAAGHPTSAAARRVTPLDQWLPYLVGLPALAVLAYDDIVHDGVQGPIRLLAVAWIALLFLRQAFFFAQVKESNAAMLEERLRAAEAEREVATLREVTRFKTQFINTAAHELGTPLTPIKFGLAELRREPASEKARQLMQVVDRSVDRIVLLVRDILDAARLQAPELRLRQEPIDLARLAADAAAEIRPAFDAKGVALAIDAPGSAPTVGDLSRLQQVILNLLDNALKYTPPGGRAALTVRPAAGGAEVSVVDSGIGFHPGEAAQLFQPFSRLPEAQAQAGTGLGLYISKALVERHGGTLTGSSPGPGKGATFRVTLPAAPIR